MWPQKSEHWNLQWNTRICVLEQKHEKTAQSNFSQALYENHKQQIMSSLDAATYENNFVRNCMVRLSALIRHKLKNEWP